MLAYRIRLLIELLHTDCMEYMKGLDDNAFDLAIVDPPYGITSWSSTGNQSIKEDQIQKLKRWDYLPDQQYFDELFRVSKAAIVWGGNHFLDYLGKCTTMIVWDKKNRDCHFADAEIAWTNISKGNVRIFDKYTVQNGNKIHPTQKPVVLYKWLMDKYTKQGDRILDTHLGSGSSAIAAHYGGFDFVGMEIDLDYYNAACKRFDAETSQLAMAL